jgi:hypothetical protein
MPRDEPPIVPVAMLNRHCAHAAGVVPPVSAGAVAGRPLAFLKTLVQLAAVGPTGDIDVHATLSHDHCSGKAEGETDDSATKNGTLEAAA